MAAIGMKHLVGAPWAAKQNEGQLPVYGTGMKIGRAVSANITFQRNESELYADDVLAESDNVLTGGNLDVIVAEILDEVGEAIFGNKKDEDGSYHDSDLASPYIGMGYLREMKLQGKSTYRATWLYKVQLAPAEESANTRGETTTWQTQRMTGEILGVTLDDGSTRFRAWKTFDKAEEATAWLNAKANYQSV